MKSTQSAVPAREAPLGPLQVGILILSLVTTLIHLVILNLITYNTEGRVDALFLLNGLGYLALMAAYFLPIPLARQNHGLVRWVFIGYNLATILAWVAIGDKSWPAGALGYFTKLIELALIVLLWLDGRSR